MAERVAANAVEIAYERGGEGTPAVFVHGLGYRREIWSEQRATLAKEGFDAIAIDLRGHGESGKPDGPYSVELWAADLIAVLDALGLERAVLVGHSIGCAVVEHAALDLGERCLALAMLGGALSFSDEFKAGLRERAALAREGRIREIGEAVAGTGLTRKASPELVERVVDLIASNDPEAYALSAEATAAAEMRQPERIGCPALAFTGAEDPVGPPEAQEAIAEAIPGGESATVPGGAHLCMIEVPEATTAPLLGFLRRHATGQSTS